MYAGEAVECRDRTPCLWLCRVRLGETAGRDSTGEMGATSREMSDGLWPVCRSLRRRLFLWIVPGKRHEPYATIQRQRSRMIYLALDLASQQMSDSRSLHLCVRTESTVAGSCYCSAVSPCRFTALSEWK